MKFWITALRYHAPATLAAFVFFYLTLSLINNESTPMDNPWVTLIFLIVIANFCAYLLSRANASRASKGGCASTIKNNKIKDNEVRGSLRATAPMGDGGAEVKVSGNELSGNKVGGDFVLGVDKRDE